MARDGGLDRADIDTALMGDPKVGALARRLRDSTKTAAALALYVAVVLGSWKDGERLNVEEALPGWWLDDCETFAEALQAVGLLDDELRVPVESWDHWYGPARERMERYRERASAGGRASAQARAQAAAQPRGAPQVKRSVHTKPDQANQSKPTSSRARAGEAGGPARLGDVIAKLPGGKFAAVERQEDGS